MIHLQYCNIIEQALICHNNGFILVKRRRTSVHFALSYKGDCHANSLGIKYVVGLYDWGSLTN